MRKGIIIILIILFINLLYLFSSFALAQEIKYPLSPTFVNTNTDSLISAGKEIYGYSMVGTNAKGNYVELYDSETVAGGDTSNLISSIKIWNVNSQTIWFPEPIITTNGCSVKLSFTNIIIYHQP